MSFKAFSQTDTQTVVRLSERQAREVAKDLVRYDALKEITIIQEDRIKNLKRREEILQEDLLTQDTLISKQYELIDKQNKIINSLDRVKLHSYIGIQTQELTLYNTILRGDLLLEYKKIRAGGTYTIQRYHNPVWGLTFQYRIF